MRKPVLFGIVIVGMLLGAAQANAATASEAGISFVSSERPLHRAAKTPVLQEGRAALGGDKFLSPSINAGYHDPAFSRQQDDAYDGRF